MRKNFRRVSRPYHVEQAFGGFVSFSRWARDFCFCLNQSPVQVTLADI